MDYGPRQSVLIFQYATEEFYIIEQQQFVIYCNEVMSKLYFYDRTSTYSAQNCKIYFILLIVKLHAIRSVLFILNNIK